MSLAWLDQRAVTVRLLVLLAVATGYFVLLRGEQPAGVDVALVAASVAAMTVGGKWPLTAVLTQVALLAVPALTGLGAGSHLALKVIAGVALFELALRRSGWPLVVAAVAMTGVYALYRSDDIAGLAFRAVMAIGGPLLLGAYVRTSRALAQSEVRTSIARDLHDLVAHHVASIVLRVGVARKVLKPSDRRMREVLDDIHDTGTVALADLRQLVAVLRDPSQGLVNPGELPAAVEQTVARARRIGLSIDATVDPGLAGLDAAHGLTVLRLTQEGLANVAKHAGRTAHTQLATTVTEDAVRLEIRDEGGDVPRGEPGFGLVGLRERVELLGGRLEAGPHGHGWRLLAVLPVKGVRP